MTNTTTPPRVSEQAGNPLRDLPDFDAKVQARAALTQQAAPEAPTEPLAWIVHTKSGNAHLWFDSKDTAYKWYEVNKFSGPADEPFPVYATPVAAPEAPATTIAEWDALPYAKHPPIAPEAPASEQQSDEEAYAQSGYRHFMSLERFRDFRAGVIPATTAATTASPQDALEEALACALSEHTNLSTDGIDDCVPRLVATIPAAALPFDIVPTEGIDPALYERATTASPEASRDCPDCEATGRISPSELCARCSQSGILPATTTSASGRKEMDIWNTGAKALSRIAAPIAAQLDAEGLPALPAPDVNELEPFGPPTAYSAAKVRQAQPEAIAADRARLADAQSDPSKEQAK